MDLAAVDCIGRYLCLAAFAPPRVFHQAEAYLNGKAGFRSCAGNLEAMLCMKQKRIA